HARGAALQRPCRPVSSPRLRAAGGGTREISGLGGGPGDCLPGLVVGAAASGRPRSLYRLECGGAAPQYPFSRLQSSLSHFALGPRRAFGVARSRSDGAKNRGRLGTDLRAPHLFLETFVDPERYRGTCYRAANWVVMGRTTGRGKNCPNKRPNRSIKEVLGYPLTPHFRKLLAEVEDEAGT